MDTHAFSVPALASALEVLGANGFATHNTKETGKGSYVTTSLNMTFFMAVNDCPESAYSANYSLKIIMMGDATMSVITLAQRLNL
jgi:hypothetical protein